jgi:hypothetical protein
MRRMTGGEVPEVEWEGLEFGPQGHREQGYAVLEHLCREDRGEDLLELATKMDSERSTLRTRHYIRQAYSRIGEALPDRR